MCKVLVKARASACSAIEWLKGFLYLLPGGPAFQNCSPQDRRRAYMEFSWIFGVSLSPLLLIFFLNAVRVDPFTWGGAFAKFSQYIQAGQLYFYVATVMGAVVHLLIIDRFNFREKGIGKDEDRTKQRERGWFFLYLISCFIVSSAFLCAYHLGVIKAESNVLNWSSVILYSVSLYFSLVISLYGNMTLSSPENLPTQKKIREMRGELEGFSGEGE